MLGTVANIASTWAPTRSPSASPAPLYATMVTSIPASILSSSASRRAGDPGPTVAKLIAPGLDRASVTSSATVWIGGVAVEHREQRVAVGRGPGRRRGAESSPRPRAVVDQKLPAECLGELRRHEARADVGEAACRVWDDDTHGPGGIRLPESLRQTRRC